MENLLFLGVPILKHFTVIVYFRAISKLELENKRLGRENDNLRHKVTQSIK